MLLYVLINTNLKVGFIFLNSCVISFGYYHTVILIIFTNLDTGYGYMDYG